MAEPMTTASGRPSCDRADRGQAARASRASARLAGVRCATWCCSRSPRVDRHPDRSTRSSAASATTASWRPTRSACPTRGSSTNYTDVAARRASFWSELRNSVVVAAIIDGRRRSLFAALAAFVFARIAVPGSRGRCTPLFTLGLLFPAAVAILPLLHPRPRSRAARQPARAWRCRRRPSGCRSRSSSCGRSSGASRWSSRTRRAIDGCGSFGFFWRILLPLSRPALATVAVLAIVSSWNPFLLPLVMLLERRPVDAAARRHELRDAVHDRHGPDPRLHDRSR